MYDGCLDCMINMWPRIVHLKEIAFLLLDCFPELHKTVTHDSRHFEQQHPVGLCKISGALHLLVGFLGGGVGKI